MKWWTFRRLLAVAAVLGLLLSATVVGARWWVTANSSDAIYTVDSVPSRSVVLVLGARVDADGRPSAFLAARLDLARELYESGKARVILVSGDHGQPEYNEVDPMRRYLIDAGVPGEHVVGDHAGFDTRDSCVRAKRVFGVDELVVVTQQFHINRAVALCREVGIDAVGVADESVRVHEWQWRYGATREYLANIKALWDVFWDVDPRSLGPYETGVDDALTRSLTGAERHPVRPVEAPWHHGWDE